VSASSAAAVEVVCIGESMATLLPERPAPLEQVERFHRGVGGAESNVARSLAALGVRTGWISRVGGDGFGRLLLSELAARGVDTSAVEVDPHRPTGLYVKEIGAGTGSPYDLGPENSRLRYYRTGSAASALCPETLETPAAAALLNAARLVHLSGITAAMGRLSGHDGGRRLVEALFERRRPGRLVNAGHAATASEGDAEPVTEPALHVDVLESIGAGDAFAAGYLSGLLRGFDQRRRLRLGHVCAASALMVRGDHGTPPDPETLATLLDCTPSQWSATFASDGVFTVPEGAAR